MLTSAPACNASINSFVPDLAIVPKFVNDGEGPVGLVRENPKKQLRLRIELAFVSQALEPNLVQCIRGIADELTKEDLLVAVKGVDDQTQKLVDFCLESKGLSVCHGNFFSHEYYTYTEQNDKFAVYTFYFFCAGNWVSFYSVEGLTEEVLVASLPTQQSSKRNCNK
ncbi:unnamed protein product [Prunus brigantina]